MPWNVYWLARSIGLSSYLKTLHDLQFKARGWFLKLSYRVCEFDYSCTCSSADTIHVGIRMGQRQAEQCVERVTRSKADYGMMIFADKRYAGHSCSNFHPFF
ncbi:hypothetical protein KC19_3G069100 [Ceratodon purpureus]|uniref:Uncharacterized protein n=1 Tax=Ceratodon purpureus TaxID=3225 RepID=A0A8T0II58_CERPU|nr:hypothetical protein KC19_3G069100 [Ceratodon purpureus]